MRENRLPYASGYENIFNLCFEKMDEPNEHEIHPAGAVNDAKHMLETSKRQNGRRIEELSDRDASDRLWIEGEVANTAHGHVTDRW